MADKTKQSQLEVEKTSVLEQTPANKLRPEPQEKLSDEHQLVLSEQLAQEHNPEEFLIVQKQPWMTEEGAFNLDLIFDEVRLEADADFDAVFDELFIKEFNREHENLDIMLLQKELENGDMSIKLRFSDKDLGKSLEELNNIAKELQEPDKSDTAKMVGRKIHEKLADKLEQSPNKELSDFGIRIRSFLNGSSNIGLDSLASPNLNSLTGRPYDFLAAADNANVDQTENQDEMENTGSRNLTPGG